MRIKRSVLRHGFTALCVLTAGVAGSGVAAAGESAPASAGQSVVVQLKDLNLNAEQGSRVAYVRLKSAARRVCGRIDWRNAGAGVAWRSCYRAALDNAVAELGSARVTALNAASSPRSTR